MRFRNQALSWALMGIFGVGMGSMAGGVALGQVPTTPPPDSAQAGGNGKAIGTVQDLSRAFRNVGKEVEPMVVSIKVRKTIEAPQGARRMPPGFRRFFEEMPDFPGFPPDGFGGGEQMGQGSGVIVAVEGSTAYIVTNNHVAGDADEMTIALHDGRQIENGKLVGADAKTDLAVLRIEADGLKAAKWGDSDELEKGDWVLAFGSPFGYVGSMTHGIVSATNRTDLRIIPQGYEAFIQIDAPINPGNSGGPLTNIHGEIVGINTAIASRTGGFQGIGFAIPSNQAKQIFEILREDGKVVRGWLGVKIASVREPDTRQVARRLGYEGEEGVFVHETFPDTPAFGVLENGDVITKLNGKAVRDATELRTAIALIKPGTEAKLEVVRNGKPQTVSIKLGEQPADLAVAGAPADDRPREDGPTAGGGPRVGVELNDLTPEIARQLGLRRDLKGAVIRRVMPGSPAARAGLNVGEVITRVNDQTVNSANEAIAAIRKLDLNEGAVLYVVGPGGGRFVFVQATARTSPRQQ